MYNRSNATQYALEFWNKRNSNYLNFDSLGGDCTNFISQCLFAGGYEMDYTNMGWFYRTGNDRSYSWTGVYEMFNYLTTNENPSFPRAKLVDFNEVEVGDLIQIDAFGDRFHHTAIITKIIEPISLSTIFITCHTRDAKNKPLASYNARRIRFLKMI